MRHSLVLLYKKNESNVEINLYNLLGKIEVQLFKGKMLAGNHQLKWDGMVNTKQLARGTYILEIKSKTYSVNKKIMIN